VATRPMLRVVEREVLVFARLWRGIVFSLFLSPLLYLAAMGVGLGGLVKAHTGNVGGVTYLQFVTPGMLVAVAMQVAAGESMWPVLGGVKWVQNYHAAVATSIDADDVLYGTVLWIALRAMLGAVAFVAVAALLGGIPSAWGILAIPVAGVLYGKMYPKVLPIVDNEPLARLIAFLLSDCASYVSGVTYAIDGGTLA